MRILITGVTGFVGQNLASFLIKNKYSVLGITRTPETKDQISFEGLNQLVFNQAKAIVHLAGKAHDLKKTSDDKAYFEVNTDLTKSLFDQFLQSDCEVFIYMSSVKAAADSVPDILDENVVPSPITPYGKSKQLAEQYILSKELPENKRVYILRPCMIHGPGNKGNLNLLYNFASKGLPYPLAAYDNKRSFLSVDNLSFVIKQLIEHNVDSGIYNVSDDESLSTNQVVSLIATSLDKKPSLLPIPKGVMSFLAKTGDFLKLPLNTERLGKMTENYQVSNSKLVKALGVKLPLTTQQGLLITFKSFKNAY